MAIGPRSYCKVWRRLDVDRDGRDHLASLLQHGMWTVRTLLWRTGLHWLYALQTGTWILGFGDDAFEYFGIGTGVINARSCDDRFAVSGPTTHTR